MNNAKWINDQLETNPDIIGCLVNCSSNGKCMLNEMTSKFKCNCNQHFTGVKCDIDLSPCALHPCLNGGTCLETTTNSLGYICICKQFFNGTLCEKKVNICQNETCSSNGFCVDSQNMPTCQCFYLYTGQKCETKSEKLVVIMASRKVSVIVAAIALCLLTLIVILLDLNCCKIKKSRATQIKTNNFVKLERPVYVNFKK